jgi:hypothetical protein
MAPYNVDWYQPSQDPKLRTINFTIEAYNGIEKVVLIDADYCFQQKIVIFKKIGLVK